MLVFVFHLVVFVAFGFDGIYHLAQAFINCANEIGFCQSGNEIMANVTKCFFQCFHLFLELRRLFCRLPDPPEDERLKFASLVFSSSSSHPIPFYELILASIITRAVLLWIMLSAGSRQEYVIASADGHRSRLRTWRIIGLERQVAPSRT